MSCTGRIPRKPRKKAHGPKKPTSSVSTATVYFLDYVPIETDIATDTDIQTYLYRDRDTVMAKLEAWLKKKINKQQRQKTSVSSIFRALSKYLLGES